MIPQFTADAGLARPRARYLSRRVQSPAPWGLLPQQRIVMAPEGGEDPNALAWGGTGHTITCPGCAQHPCGFLGLSTCLTCC